MLRGILCGDCSREFSNVFCALKVKHVMVDGELRHDEFPVILQQVDGDLYGELTSNHFGL